MVYTANEHAEFETGTNPQVRAEIYCDDSLVVDGNWMVIRLDAH